MIKFVLVNCKSHSITLHSLKLFTIPGSQAQTGIVLFISVSSALAQGLR